MSSIPSWAGTLAEHGATCLMQTYARVPLELVSGRGCHITDSQGRTYLDLAAGIAVSALGHGHPAVTGALRQATEGLLHTSNLYWTEPMVRLAERLTRAAGMDRAFFCNSGAETVEAALKLARRTRPERSRFLVFEQSFHGRTLGALSATAQAHHQEAFRPLLDGFAIAPFGDFDAAVMAITAETAAVLVEPIQGEGGMRSAPPGWLAHLSALCRRTGALLMLDEVQCGMGRTGHLLACQGEDVTPDVVALAKGIAGGLPMGALLARGEAALAFRPGDHASTFGGGPLVASVADAVLQIILGPGFLESVRQRSAELEDGLQSLTRRHTLVAGVRGRGLMRGLVLRQESAADLVAALRGRGILAISAGPAVLRLVPPLIISAAEIDAALQGIDAALSELEAPAAGVEGRA